jgi:hypothetical protein
MRTHICSLALARAVTATGSASAEPRSPFEQPDPVRTVKMHVDGQAMLAKAQAAGIDFSGNVARVPDGIEADAVVTTADVLALEALGM